MRYAIFICTHGRPDSQLTLLALRRGGYTGLIFLVLDDEDETGADYLKYENENTKILVFNKQEWIDKSETGSITEVRKTILYAKNFCEWIACEQFKLDAYVLADDDLTKFYYPCAGMEIKYYMQRVLFNCMQYLLSNNIGILGFIVKPKNEEQMSLLPKIAGFDRLPYHFILRNCSIRISWRSFISQDLIGNIDTSLCGNYIFNLPWVQYLYTPNASVDGGMKDTYTKLNSYVRVFSAFKYYPSSLGIIHGDDGIFDIRLKKDYMQPKLISSRYKK